MSISWPALIIMIVLVPNEHFLTSPLFLLSLVLYTGTQLYHNTRFVASISEPVFHCCPFDIHFDIFCPKYFKRTCNLCLAVNSVENLTTYFCFALNCMLPLFCAGVRFQQCARIQEISCWEEVEKAIVKLLSVWIIQSFWHVWKKDIIQVSYWFGSRKCDV